MRCPLVPAQQKQRKYMKLEVLGAWRVGAIVVCLCVVGVGVDLVLVYYTIERLGNSGWRAY